MITMNINLDTHRHRQTDQRALDEIIQRPSLRAGSPTENLSVRPSDSPGRFCRRIKTRNCRVGQTHARTHYVNLYIRYVSATLQSATLTASCSSAAAFSSQDPPFLH
jgi:hypothetical protein